MNKVSLWGSRFVLWVATGFGVGRLPLAPGTFGTLWGVFVAWVFFRKFSIPAQVLFSVVLTILAVPICDCGERVLGTKDPHPVVADEYLTFPISVIGLPVQNPWVLAIAFLTNRAMDIIKPFPARDLQQLRGGLGIVADDAVASLYSLLLNHLIWWLLLRYGAHIRVWLG